MKLPKLMYYSTVLPASCYHIYSVETNGLTEPEATEVIRRAEAHEGLVGAVKELIYRLKWVSQEEDEQSCVNESIKQGEQALAGEPKNES